MPFEGLHKNFDAEQQAIRKVLSERSKDDSGVVNEEDVLAIARELYGESHPEHEVTEITKQVLLSEQRAAEEADK